MSHNMSVLSWATHLRRCMVKLLAIVVIVVGGGAGCVTDEADPGPMGDPLAHAGGIYLKLDGIAGETKGSGRQQAIFTFGLTGPDSASASIASDCIGPSC